MLDERVYQQTKQDSLVPFPYVHVIEITNVITFANVSQKSQNHLHIEEINYFLRTDKT